MAGLDWIIASGSASLGFVLGMLIGLHVADSDKTTERVLLSCIGVILGATIIGAFKYFFGDQSPSREIWFYPIGLAVGFPLGMLISHIWHRWLISRGLLPGQQRSK